MQFPDRIRRKRRRQLRHNEQRVRAEARKILCRLVENAPVDVVERTSYDLSKDLCQTHPGAVQIVGVLSVAVYRCPHPIADEVDVDELTGFESCSDGAKDAVIVLREIAIVDPWKVVPAESFLDTHTDCETGIGSAAEAAMDRIAATQAVRAQGA